MATTPNRFLHTMLHVTDMERTLAFYCGLLGMEIQVDRFNPATQHRNVFVGHGPAETHPQLEFTSYGDKAAYEKGDAWGHIAIGVPDCEAALRFFEANEVKVTREARRAPSGAVIAFIEDPDGYAIEVIQPAPPKP